MNAASVAPNVVREAIPWPNILPSGSPVAVQTTIGFPSAAARRRASLRSSSQGICSHGISPGLGLMEARRLGAESVGGTGDSSRTTQGVATPAVAVTATATATTFILLQNSAFATAWATDWTTPSPAAVPRAAAARVAVAGTAADA